ncbi:hypothetical protein ASPZODRAFT_149318 [Penicilliopsis zonata CBS 506.65]|uniref:SCP domain-containing protein n=1 Tax=Penicilliopsis zonata CBS 506.65 TaxID=1073090 RepID=A0A1L9SRV1_9EURO|nr:hypothetical protein ASPZODRAFT_149318 [Penicilliopsis zonata CBS 506.65]OJJ49856.1 hypothetical protein ASPZODRAFT_149318 [Penicilliopsis zonata CBS 506.65]
MRSAFLLSAVCAAGVLANPVDKRAVVTDVTVVTVTDYVTLDTTQTTTTTEVPVVTVTETPVAAENYVTTVDVDAVDPTSTSSAAAVVVETTTSAISSAEPTSTPIVLEVSTSSTSTSTSSAASSTLVTSTSAAASSTATSTYQEAVLYNHNIHRSNHSANSVTWSSSLEASARVLAETCVYEHDTSIDGGGYGQNIGYGVSADNIGEMLTDLMYNDEFGYFEGLYGEADPSMTYFDNWGHFSQIVWKATTEVACVTVTCDTLGNVDADEALPFTVCNYYPAGNYDGEYADNVGEPLGQPYYSVA